MISQGTSQTDAKRIAKEGQVERWLMIVVRLGALFCLGGWTWGHLYWEGPYGVLVWHDASYELASKFGVQWDAFVGSGADDGLVQTWISRIGWLYLICAVLTLTAGKRSWLQMLGLLGGSLLLVVLSYAKFLTSQRQLPMFVEHGGQMLMPALLVAALALGVRHRVTVCIALVAFVMTFAGHGSYALGLWPTPATFYAMTSVILNVEFETARMLLRIAGVLDFVVCVGLFLPAIRRYCALYAVVWGLLTALARPVAGMSWGLNYWGADQFVHEAVLRAPHFVIPLYLFILWSKPQGASSTSNSINKDQTTHEVSGTTSTLLAQ